MYISMHEEKISFHGAQILSVDMTLLPILEVLGTQWGNLNTFDQEKGCGYVDNGTGCTILYGQK